MRWPELTSESAVAQDAIAELTEALAAGTLTITGRLVGSSNQALVGQVRYGERTLACVYKPIAAERPLWDFPDGSLAGREVAAYQVSVAAGWNCVPVTVLRDGPFGVGMVQEWIAAAEPGHAADLFPAEQVPDGFLPVLRAEAQDGQQLVLAHSGDLAVAILAGFDVVTNNADRKAAHILPTADGRLRGVDHGLTMHSEPKLRTILWGWAGQALPSAVVAGLDRLAAWLPEAGAAELAGLITPAETAALSRRVARLRARPRFPLPPVDRNPIPWPPL